MIKTVEIVKQRMKPSVTGVTNWSGCAGVTDDEGRRDCETME